MPNPGYYGPYRLNRTPPPPSAGLYEGRGGGGDARKRARIQELQRELSELRSTKFRLDSALRDIPSRPYSANPIARARDMVLGAAHLLDGAIRNAEDELRRLGGVP